MMQNIKLELRSRHFDVQNGAPRQSETKKDYE